MTILQGTMQDGTVIPVQVDAQGRLVAEGLQGPAGPAGPQGPQGDPGPGGGMTLPPGAKEGWALGWVNGALGWVHPVLHPPPPFDAIESVSSVPAFSWYESHRFEGAGFGRQLNPDGLFNANFTDGGLNLVVSGTSDNSQERWNGCVITLSQPYSGNLEVLGYAESQINFGGQTLNNTAQVNGTNISGGWVNDPANGYGSWMAAGSYSSRKDIQFFWQTSHNPNFSGGGPTMNIVGIRVNGQVLSNRGAETSVVMATARGLDTLAPGVVLDEQGPSGATGVQGTVRTVDLATRTIYFNGLPAFASGNTFELA